MELRATERTLHLPSKKSLLSSLLRTTRDPTSTSRCRQLCAKMDLDALNVAPSARPKDDSDGCQLQRTASNKRKQPSFLDCFRQGSIQLSLNNR